MSEEKITEKKAEAKVAKAKPVQIDIKPGMTVRVHEKIREKNSKGEEKERVQIFEGIVLARKHGKEIGNTITVRKVASGIGVEKIFPMNSPLIVKVEAIKQATVRRAKLGFIRTSNKKLKEVKL